MVKKGNVRISVTLESDYIDKLKLIKFDLKTYQNSKAIKYLIENYKKNI